MRVDVGIACNKNQPFQWWNAIMGELLRIQKRGTVEIGQLLCIGAATPDWVKNRVSELFVRPDTTAENRSEIVERSDADAIWWIDDDTVPPSGALEALLERRVEIAAALYYRRCPPYNPIAYKQQPNGGYTALYTWQLGEILDVDSVGMGCTVVRREAYERIRDAHVLFRRRSTGSLVPVLKEAVVLDPAAEWAPVQRDHVALAGGVPYLVQPLTPVGDDVERWPYYVMEWERTEDHYFCEMARAVGCRIVVDTAIECSHWGQAAVTGDDYRAMHQALEMREGVSDAGG